MTTRRRVRTGCLWMLGLWVWFGLVLALSDLSVKSPGDRLVQLVFGLVILSPLIVAGWTRRRRA